MLNLTEELASLYRRDAGADKINTLSCIKKWRATKNDWVLNDAKYYLRNYKRNLRNLQELEKKRNREVEEKIEELLETYYPGNFDTYGNTILIHLPSIVVTDINGSQHTIYDLYFKIDVDSDFSHDVSARRSSYSPEEIFSYYLHSHISAYFQGWSSSICFGNFNYKKTGDSNEETLLLSLESLFIVLPDFLSYESSDTNPYKLLTSIGNFNEKYSGVDNNFFSIQNIDFDITYSLVNGIPMFHALDNERLDSYLIERYPDKALAYQRGDEFYMNAMSEDTTIEDFKTFMYKGEEVQFKLLPSTKTIPEKTINQHFKQDFINNTKYEITKKLIAASTFVSQSVAENIGEPVSEDSVSVLQD